jgi:ferredoxin
MQDAPSTYSFFPEHDFRSFPPRPVGLDRLLAPDVFEAHSAVCFQYPEAVPPADESALAVYRKELLHFFRSGEGGGLPGSGNLKPALLVPFLRSQLPGVAYPVWMPDEESFSRAHFPEGRCWSVDQILETAVTRFAPGEGESLPLKAHLGRIGRIIRQKLDLLGGAVHAASLWGEAFQELQKELQLKGVEGLQLASDLHKLQRALPPGGLFIPFSPWGHTELFLGLLARYRRIQMEQTEAKASLVLSHLRGLLARDILPPDDTHDQLKGMVEEIEQVLGALREGTHFLLGKQYAEKSKLNPERHFPGCKFKVLEETELFGEALKIFEQNASLMVRLLINLEKAGQTLDNQFETHTNGNLSGLLAWEAFSESEKALCPLVAILTDTVSLSDKALGGFLECLGKGYPVKVLATRQGGAKGGIDLAAAAISVKKALVVQSTALDPNALLAGFSKGLEGSGPAFFHLFGEILSVGNNGSQRFLNACAALESRVFPAIRYEPENDLRWGQRFRQVFNPQPERDWPVHHLEIKVAKEGVQAQTSVFTAVDFAALDPSLASGFKLVPPEYAIGGLVPLADYLLDGEGAETTSIPFIWMADDQLHLYRAAVSQSLVKFCRSCLDSWRYIQENTGIRNYHAEHAVESYKNQFQPTLEVSKGQQVQAAELEAYASAAVKAAMEQLAASLLGFPLSGISDALTTATAPSEDHATILPEVTAPLPTAPGQVADTLVPEVETPAEVNSAPAPTILEVEAWIDSPLCTSCNECVDNFPQIFSYNDDKQAFVASPRGGAYADLVRAAERCPVSIIHPGTPWDKSDPDLAALSERARPFQ